MISYRKVSLLLFLASVVGMSFALYLQYHQHLEPCPLCIFQRVGLMSLGLVSLIAFIHGPKNIWVKRFYALLSVVAVGWSASIAGRHVWLQHLPPEDVPACGPGLDYWLDTFPLKDVIGKVLHGSGECAKIDWTFMGQSLPFWSLSFFTLLLLISLYQLFRRR